MEDAAIRERRWWGWLRCITRPGEPGTRIPYLDRYSFRKQGPSGTNPWRVYLNHFRAPDVPGHHDHPSRWSFSLVLWGSYTEEILIRPDDDFGHEMYGADYRADGTAVLKRRRRWFNWIPAGRYHRVSELHPGPGATGVWTLFFCGPLTGKPWGFYVTGKGHVPAGGR